MGYALICVRIHSFIHTDGRIFRPELRPGEVPFKAALSASDCDRIKSFITANAINRRMPYWQVGQELGLPVSEHTIRKAVRRKGMNRRVARVKPYLSESTHQRRLAYALERKSWTIWDWRFTFFTDESAMHILNKGRTFVTRAPDEEYHMDCVVPNFQNVAGCMVWGAISGIYGAGKSLFLNTSCHFSLTSCIIIGPLIFWDAKWGTITAERFIYYVIPIIKNYMQKHPGLTFQQDNAGAYRARATQRELLLQGIEQMYWPASSPDLNPIKNIWQILKERIRRRLRSENRPHSVYELQQLVREEWNKLTLEEIRRRIDTMPERMEAVIKNQGGHTSFCV
jgi:hypothetical protein